jgi:hypothetical protein
VDKLQHLSKSSAPSIGFHPSASEAKKPAMLLIARLSQMDVKEAEVLANNKVDAVLMSGQSTEDIGQVAKVLGDVPLGILVKNMSKEKVSELVGAGCDFVVFDVKMPLVELGQGIGKFLMLEPSLDWGLIRAINGIDVDGVFIAGSEDSFISVERLLIYHRFSELLDKPLIAPLPSLVMSAELNNLWQAGIDGVVIPSAQPEEAFTELREMINNLPREAKRGKSEAGVILPHYGGVDIEEEEEEEILNTNL